MCLFPKLVKNPKYKETKKNGGIIPAVADPRVLYVPIGCGNCMECRKMKSREWQVRLMEDIKTNTNGKFITLTFSNESIKTLYDDLSRTTKWSIFYNFTIGYYKYPHKDKLKRLRKKIIKQYYERKKIIEKGYELDNLLATRAIRLFLERWRKEYKKSLRHWLVTELGHNGTENIHLHGIVWTDNIKAVEKHWKYGFIWKGYMINGILENYVNEKTVNYITKYVSKMDLIHQKYKPIMLTSAGIGRNYVNGINARYNKYKGVDTDETYRTRTGHKINMPVYWRNKLYTEKEREELWLQKLDKNERWVLGNKIDISKGQEEYYNALLNAQMKNKQFGYGNNKKDWNREKYEHERRILIQNARLQQ